MIHLDTHVIVWLYTGLTEKLSAQAIQLIEDNPLFISPIVKLELTYLHEIKKITPTSQTIIHELQNRIGLQICDLLFDTIISKANTQIWTRDPFDRIITAQAICAHSKLITKDETIRQHYKSAIWD